jgi:hypothetical protein
VKSECEQKEIDKLRNKIGSDQKTRTKSILKPLISFNFQQLHKDFANFVSLKQALHKSIYLKRCNYEKISLFSRPDVCCFFNPGEIAGDEA